VLPMPAFAVIPEDPAAELEKLRERPGANFEAVLTTPKVFIGLLTLSG